MTNATENLDYLTVDSIQWATSHIRPRMTLEDKRAKHRVHQRDFVLRQRARLEQLRRELRCHKLQLLRLQAIQEATALTRMNDAIRQQLIPNSFLVEPTEPERLSLVEDDSAILELLELLPEIKPADIKFNDSCLYSWCKEQEDLTPLAWSATTPSAIAVVETAVRV